MNFLLSTKSVVLSHDICGPVQYSILLAHGNYGRGFCTFYLAEGPVFSTSSFIEL